MNEYKEIEKNVEEILSHNEQIPKNVVANKDKYHYFIGSFIEDYDQVRLLRNVQKDLRRRLHPKDFYWNNRFFYKMIYIGYMKPELAYFYMDNIFHPLLDALTQKLPVIQCKFSQYSIEEHKKYLQIFLDIEDDKGYLKDILLPYLYKNGVLPIYEKKTYEVKTQVELFNMKATSFLQNSRSKITKEIPKNNFTIPTISLIQGTTTRIRSGNPSQFDQLNLVEIPRYKYYFHEN